MKNVKFIALALMMCFAIVGFGQTKVVNNSKATIGTLDCTKSTIIHLEKGDTSTYVYIGFQNSEYTSIIDRKSIMFNATDSVNILQFKKDLKMSLSEMGNGSSMTWERKKYKLRISDNASLSKILFLYDGNESGYTTISKKSVQELIDWLENIGYKG